MNGELIVISHGRYVKQEVFTFQGLEAEGKVFAVELRGLPSEDQPINVDQPSLAVVTGQRGPYSRVLSATPFGTSPTWINQFFLCQLLPRLCIPPHLPIPEITRRQVPSQIGDRPEILGIPISHLRASIRVVGAHPSLLVYQEQPLEPILIARQENKFPFLSFLFQQVSA